jgi:hypothetical protein
MMYVRSYANSYSYVNCLGLVVVVEDIGKVATSTVLAILHGSHENTGTALC